SVGVRTSWRRLVSDIFSSLLSLATSSSRVAVDEEAGELLQTPAHPGLGGIQDCGNALVHGLRYQDVAGDQRVSLHLESSFDFSDVELYLRIRPVEHRSEERRVG